MSKYETVRKQLQERPARWLVSGVAGFIGSHLAAGLLALGQGVVGLDNFSTGKNDNLEAIKAGLTQEQLDRFSFLEGDIRDASSCEKVCKGVDYVLHHAAIASVPKSFDDPSYTDQVNSGGFLCLYKAASDAGVKHFVYASSSAVYGDGADAPRHEGEAHAPQSPYAVSKCANELNAAILSAHTGMKSTGLRYFNIFGARQDPNGAYAAVLPRWMAEMKEGKQIEIYGDGETVRDFCFIDDVVQANILAATRDGGDGAVVYNIASGQGTSLNQLFGQIRDNAGANMEPVYKDFRAGDIRVSIGDIAKAQKELGFAVTVSLKDGLAALGNA